MSVKWLNVRDRFYRLVYLLSQRHCSKCCYCCWTFHLHFNSKRRRPNTGSSCINKLLVTKRKLKGRKWSDGSEPLKLLRHVIFHCVVCWILNLLTTDNDILTQIYLLTTRLDHPFYYSWENWRTKEKLGNHPVIIRPTLIMRNKRNRKQIGNLKPFEALPIHDLRAGPISRFNKSHDSSFSGNAFVYTLYELFMIYSHH